MALTVGFDGKFLWSGHIFGSHSGHGVHSRYLLKEMLDCYPQHRFHIYVLDNGFELEHRNNCRVITLPKYARNAALRNSVAYPIELVRRPVDVLLAFSTIPAFVRCKTVLLLADVFMLANPSWFPARFRVPRTIALQRSVARADVIVTTTEFSRREIVRLLRVREDKVVVVPHGVRTEFADRIPDADRTGVCSRYGITMPYILSINDIHPRKNLEGLVEAFEHLKARRDLPHQLVVAGRTLWSYPGFYGRVAASRFAADIKVLGYVPSDDVLALYSGADLYVYPSFYEGWGLQVHEAMMAGVPVAVSRDSSMSEIAGDAAETFDPHDAEDISRSMERILTKAGLRDILIARGHEQVKRYSWREAAAALMSVCTGIAGA